jgi:hypothetical protein
VASLSDRTKVLFIGSSHFLFGIRPQRYSIDAVNLSATWLDYSCIRRVLEKHLARVPNLRVAVIEYDELPLVADLVSAMLATNDPRPLSELALTPIEMPVAGLSQRLQTAWITFSYPVRSLPRVTPLEWLERAGACSPLYHPRQGFAAGYYYTDAVTPPSFKAQIVFDALNRASLDERVVRRNLADLQQTVGELQARGVTVVLLRLPHARDYTRGRPPAVTARWRQLEAWARTQHRVVVLDWDARPEFQPGDFCDNHHLNVFGADKLAPFLDAQLRALCVERQ